MADTRQQAVILQATTAVPDPRWNETSKCIHPPTPIRIKTPVTLVEWGRISEISTVLNADIQSFSPGEWEEFSKTTSINNVLLKDESTGVVTEVSAKEEQEVAVAWKSEEKRGTVRATALKSGCLTKG